MIVSGLSEVGGVRAPTALTGKSFRFVRLFLLQLRFYFSFYFCFAFAFVLFLFALALLLLLFCVVFAVCFPVVCLRPAISARAVSGS